eukprot:2848230-Pleurochrysis_carterae.AAC.1
MPRPSQTCRLSSSRLCPLAISARQTRPSSGVTRVSSGLFYIARPTLARTWRTLWVCYAVR